MDIKDVSAYQVNIPPGTPCKYYIPPKKLIRILKRLENNLKDPSRTFVTFSTTNTSSRISTKKMFKPSDRCWGMRLCGDYQKPLTERHLTLGVCPSSKESPSDDMIAFIVSRELALLERAEYYFELSEKDSYKHYKRLVPTSDVKAPQYTERLKKEQKEDTRRSFIWEEALDMKVAQPYLSLKQDDTEVYSELRALRLMHKAHYNPCIILNKNVAKTSKNILQDYLQNKLGGTCT